MDGHPSLRERKKQRTYQAISDAAIALFLEQGFDQVSVAEIAAAAMVSKPTLFRYFPTKEDLALYRFADHEGEASRVVRDRAPEQSPLQALHAHFRAGLDRRDPVTGLCDDSEVLAFHRLLYGTPSLVARLYAYTTRSEEALARTLYEVAHAPEATHRPADAPVAVTGAVPGPLVGPGLPGAGPDLPVPGSALPGPGEPTRLEALTARLTASQVIAAQRILALDNWRRIADGESADAVYPSAVAAADHAFSVLGSHL
ncbi:TetR family transcriptional regulator [Streptomyces sp. 71268]|uniref:TetR/AcrR family transcriptional regulator n=1 Tax=Streptomyces sp. 71268 TaxID=3002640 RepID=UPI0023FA0EBE|nr:TetR family transcriptional regulator [Streptomyces sp. 71268]WEV27322.1 TetR family transcriptional regulator [Streptomyces sp. 71268]